MTETTLHSIEDIQRYFINNRTIYYFISATNFNLMFVSDWVKNWINVNFIDCYNGRNKSVMIAEYNEAPVFNDIESINQFLLGNKTIVEHIKQSQQKGYQTNAMFLFYDKELEKLVDSLKMNLVMPPYTLVKLVDNKITTTEIGNSVDVPSVPNALVKIKSYTQLRQTIENNDLGDEVVIQTAYGDSGKTTFFISSEEDYHAVADSIEAEDKVKVMKRIQCQQVAMEACATRQGTFIGPILTEIIGHPRLTPYQGGWCGNDINPDIFDAQTQNTMYDYTQRIGQALYQKGYRGYFEVDYLIETVDAHSQVYLGEINPRITGISAITNMSACCNQMIPLFLFHLLEFSKVKFDLDPDWFNQQVKDFSHPPFGQLVFKYTQKELKIVTRIPDTGIYTMKDNKLYFVRHSNNPRFLDRNEIFILRILSVDEYVYKGADILVLFANKQLKGDDNKLTEIAESLIGSVENSVDYRALSDEEYQLTQRYGKRAGFKSSIDTGPESKTYV